MDAKSPLWPHMKAFLPEVVVDGEPIAEATPYFFGSVRYIMQEFGERSDMLLIRVLNLNNYQTGDILVTDLNFMAAVPTEHSKLCANVAKKLCPKHHFTENLFNSDNKKHAAMTVYIFDSRKKQQAFIKSTNAILQKECDTSYTFGDHLTTLDGNTVALYNNLLTSHVYFLAPDMEDKICRPHNFVFHANYHSEKLINLSSFVSHIKREGSFDVETIIKEAHILPELQCMHFKNAYFKDYKEMGASYSRIKDKWPYISLDQPPRDEVTMKCHEITSISLVVGNYHLPKPKDTHRKDMYVFYNAGMCAKPLEKIDTSELHLDWNRVKFVPCTSEFMVLLSFLKTLVQSVDILYVYNANFDVNVIKQRIAYYCFLGREPGCCATHDNVSVEKGLTLRMLWENFLSKQPDLVKPQLVLGQDLVYSMYNKLNKSIFEVMSSGKSADSKLKEINIKKEQFHTNKSHVQNLKSICYGTDIVDLMLVAQQKAYDGAKTGKLNDKAVTVISKFKPHKLLVKCMKMKDVKYEQLDHYYRSGGKLLAEALVYNLVDSLLLMRMAKCINPVSEYVLRMVSSLNMDHAVHTRGTGQFSGFVASTKVVEVSRNKARLDSGTLMSTGYLRHWLYTAENIERRGGYVMQPQTGLNFAVPGRGLETIVDFASLYPSIMCDLNISPETIVSIGRENFISDYVAYDWSTLGKVGFEKYTLVLQVVRPPDGKPPFLARHFSDTSISLRRFLDLRTQHKKKIKTSESALAKEFHNRLQQEMKICANAHYGVSDLTCSLMITTQGQHKIKCVNKELYKMNTAQHEMFPMYGDTDSTMFENPPDTQEELDDSDVQDMFDSELKKYMEKKFTDKVMQYMKTRMDSTQKFVDRFLDIVKDKLLDDMISRMVLFTNTAGGRSLPPVKAEQCKASKDWFFTDPLTNTRMNASQAFKDKMLTKLEYENCASIYCHVTKKMYVCLVHELVDGVLAHTAVKKRGMTGFKTSRFGATETITNDFVDLIFKGHVLKVCQDSIESMELVSWEKVQVDDELLLFPRGGSEADSLVSCRVMGVSKDQVENAPHHVMVYVSLMDTQTSKTFTRCVYLHEGHNMSHLLYKSAAGERLQSFVKLAEYRTFSVAMGLVPWTHVCKHAKVTALKEEFKTRREKYGLLVGKNAKLSYVTLLDKKSELTRVLKRKDLTFPSEWVKQDPVMACYRKYPINMSLETLMRDYFGQGFKCEVPGFKPQYQWEKTKRNVTLIKSQIDSVFLNENSKCLAHVLVALHCHKNLIQQQTDVGEFAQAVVQRVIDVKQCLKDLISRGQNLFYALMGNCPPELTNSDNFCYNVEGDRAMRSSISPQSFLYGKPHTMLEHSVSFLRATLPSMENKQLSFLSKTVPCVPRTLTILPPQLAERVGLQDRPQLVLEGNDTDHPDLIHVAQKIYLAILCLHATEGERFKPVTLPMTAVKAPPARCTKEELKSFLHNLNTYVVQQRNKELVAHCTNCLHFWESTGDTADLLGLYNFDGKLFHLKVPGCFQAEEIGCIVVTKGLEKTLTRRDNGCVVIQPTAIYKLKQSNSHSGYVAVTNVSVMVPWEYGGWVAQNTPYDGLVTAHKTIYHSDKGKELFVYFDVAAEDLSEVLTLLNQGVHLFQLCTFPCLQHSNTPLTDYPHNPVKITQFSSLVWQHQSETEKAEQRKAATQDPLPMPLQHLLKKQS